jgi:predicted transcriptional regulator
MSKIKNFPINKKNPFLQQAVEEVNKTTVRKFCNSTGTSKNAILEAIDPETGEVLGHTSFVRQIMVDEEKFVKLYLSNFQKFFDLSTAGIRVFGYIIKHLAIGAEEIWIDIEEAQEFTGYHGKTTIYRGLTELLEAGIIARGKAELWYFINPLCLFNGNRVTYVESYVKEQREQQQQELEVEEEQRREENAKSIAAFETAYLEQQASLGNSSDTSEE